ncbi:DUF6328 family protein [Propionibacterium sp.]|uniref:DUF6328 family protein n=1 Tax=Propionibacterium sp. TaxID=1977903 RepID=UPI0039EC57C8
MSQDPDDPVAHKPPAERNETVAESLDRNWSELLQELRVSQTGIQILSGFLLTLPFQARFIDLHGALLGIYLAAALMATLSTALIMAPVMAHRLRFRHHAKDDLVRFGNFLAKAGLGCLGLTVALVVTVVFGFTIDLRVGIITGICCLLGFVLLWGVLPTLLVRSSPTTPYRREPR